MFKFILVTTFSLLFSTQIMAQQYTMPPISSTSDYVPVISDEMMEQCVEIYNKAKWLSNELNNTYVDQYSSYEVNQYDQKVSQHQQWTDWFNQHCAGKQSRSACEATQELNRKAGNPVLSCQ